MNSTSRQLFRNTLLIQLAAARSLPLTVETLHVGARLAGFPVAVAETEEEIVYLLDKKLIEPVENEISPEIKTYRINANGRDYLAKQGLA